MIPRTLEDLVRSVREGMLPAWTSLPSERDLAQQFGTSRHSVRRALDDLDADGYLLRIRGRGGGTQIRPRRVRHEFGTLRSVPTSLTSQGFDVGCTVHEVRVRRPGARALASLGLAEGDQVVEVVRSRSIGGAPYSLERACLPLERVPGLVDLDVSGSLYGLLEDRFGISVVQAEEEIGAVNAGPDESAVLDVEEGAALLRVVRTGFDTGGKPVEFSRDLFVGSQFLGVASLQRRGDSFVGSGSGVRPDRPSLKA